MNKTNQQFQLIHTSSIEIVYSQMFLIFSCRFAVYKTTSETLKIYIKCELKYLQRKNHLYFLKSKLRIFPYLILKRSSFTVTTKKAQKAQMIIMKINVI